MVVARRLLLGGGGAFPVPPLPFTVVAELNAGGWSEVTGPHAVYDGAGRTFIAWVGGNNKINDIEVAAYVHATGAIEGPVLLKDNLTGGTSTSPDSHNGPAVCIASDGHLVVAYCAHNSALMTVKRSNAPIAAGWVASGFTSAITANTSGTMTYPMLASLGSTLWLCWRDRDGAGARIRRASSTDGGATWNPDAVLFEVAADFVYSAFAGGSSRIDFAVTDKEPDAGDYGLWHFYMEEDGDCFKSDGTSAGAVPLDTTDITQLVPTGNDSYPYSVSYTADARPVIACQTKTEDPVEIFEYRWSGSAWARHDIDTSDPISPSVLSVGGGCHVWSNANRFIHSKMVSGALRVVEYRTTDDGVTWTQVADHGSGSSPVYVRAGSGLVALWFSPASSFTDSDTFEPGLAGVA